MGVVQGGYEGEKAASWNVDSHLTFDMNVSAFLSLSPLHTASLSAYVFKLYLCVCVCLFVQGHFASTLLVSKFV